LLVSPNLVKLNEGLMAKFKAVDGFGRLPHKRNAAEGAYVAQLVQSTATKWNKAGVAGSNPVVGTNSICHN